MSDLYSVLGIPRSASSDDIKRAYRDLAKKHHPDKGGDTNKFVEIQNAYEVLSDDNKKRHYDQTGSAEPNPFGGFSFNPFDFINGQPPRQRKLEDTIHNIDISMNEAYTGITKNLNIHNISRCDCVTQCSRCQGSGIIKIIQSFGPIRMVAGQQSCDICERRGYLFQTTCTKCNKGQIENTINIKLTIPPGARSNEQVRLENKGRQPFQSEILPGDLVFVVNVKEHPIFKRRDDDLIYSSELSLCEMICGTDIKIPHFRHDVIVNTTNFGVLRENKEYVIGGLGFPKSDGTCGNLILIFSFSELGPISQEDKEQLEKILEKY
jgi:DnaJ-class molecular chaperone